MFCSGFKILFDTISYNMKEFEDLGPKERFPASVSVSLIMNHGRSNRLLLTHHGVKKDEPDSWGLIAGGVEKGEDPWQAVIREAWEEANVRSENIIFVKGRNSLEPHVALINQERRISLGLVFDVTYSGPTVPLDGWEIDSDSGVDRVRFFTWGEVLSLLDNKESIYRSEFNFSQILRWTLKYYKDTEKRRRVTDDWLHRHVNNIPGLLLEDGNWKYYPPYNSWLTTPHIHGNPSQTNFARERFTDS